MIYASSFLFIPANKSRYLYNEAIDEADALIIDFEDSLDYKATGNYIDSLNTALKVIKKQDIYIRIDTRYFQDIIININLDLIKGVMVPKFTLSEVNMRILKEISKLGKQTLILIENSKGIIELKDILSKFKIDGVFFGSEDYITSINATRSCENLFYPRSNIINISKAYNVSCYDTIYPNLKDEFGFNKEVDTAFDMGFDGKMAIHPNQIAYINEKFKYNVQKINLYKNLVQQFKNYSKLNNTNIMVLDGEVIELPHIQKLKTIISKFEKRSYEDE